MRDIDTRGFAGVLPPRPVVLNVVRQLGFGGVERQCTTIAESSTLSTYSHKFVAISHEGEAGKKIRDVGGDVVCLASPSRIPSLSTILRLVQEIRRQNPTIVHTRGAEANFHGIIAAKLAGVRVVVAEEIGIPIHSRKAAMVFNILYRLTDRFVAISKAVGNALVSLGEVPVQKISVIYNPVVAPNYQVSLCTFDPLRIGFVGRLEPVKNIVALVQAVKALSDEGLNVHLHVVGDGSQRAEIVALASHLGISGRITIHGFLAQPFSVLKECNIYIQPSLTEGFGIALVEAALCGLPLLVSANGGTVEIIDHGRNGWLLDGVSPEQIAKGVRSFMNLPDEQKRAVALAGREEAGEKYTVEKYLHALDELYDSHLLDAKR